MYSHKRGGFETRPYIYFLLFFLVFAWLPTLSFAQNPETTIIIGPEAQQAAPLQNEIQYNDVTFWWAGEPGLNRHITGFYYKLDANNFIFTTSLTATLFNLPEGAHTFSVKAVDDKLSEDLSPATRSFSIKTLPPQGETEPNNAIEQSTPIAINMPVSAKISDSLDVDWYRVKVPSNAKFIIIAFERPRSTTISLYKTTETPENKIAEFISNPATQERAAFTTGIKTEGDYFIKITPAVKEGVSPETATYSLVVVTGDLPSGTIWDAEANNIPELANEIGAGLKPAPTIRVFGGTNGNSDLDWYKIHIPFTQPKKMLLNLSRSGASGSTTINLYAGLPITDLHKISAGAIDNTKDQRISLAPIAGFGDYFIRLDNTSENSAVAYLLTLNLLDVPPDKLVEAEPNTASPAISPNEANPLPIGKTLTGTSWSNNDDDWFKFEAPESGLLDILFNRPSGIGSTIVELYDFRLTKLGDFNVNFANAEKGKKRFSLKSGTYYIRLAPKDEDPNAEYQLIAMLIRSASHNAEEFPLPKDADLKVKLVTAAGWKASFDLMGNFASAEIAKKFQNIRMFDDGLHEDGLANDGVYSGSIKIDQEDNVRQATVTVRLQDPASNELILTLDLEKKVTLDTVAPFITSINQTGGRSLSLGDELMVTVRGELSLVGSFEIRAVVNNQMVTVSEKLFDDGRHSDVAFNDGIYAGIYKVKTGDNFPNALILVNLSDPAGNRITLELPDRVTLGEKMPKISSVAHSGGEILKKGDTLRVTLNATKDGFATFNLGRFRTGIPMFDDGAHDDGTVRDGVYTGAYAVSQGDFVSNAELTVQFTDVSLNSTTVVVLPQITIDAEPPPPVMGVKASDKPADEGGVAIVSWQASAASDFLRYQIYTEKTPISSVSNLKPKKLDITDPKITQTEVLLPSNRIPFYLAVTAVDSLGNESLLNFQSNGSVSVPVQASDNLAPQAVETVSAFDTPDDKGGMITVVWSKPSSAADFSHYNIYLSEVQIELGQTQGLGRTQGSPLQGQPIAVIRDRNALFADLPLKSNATNYFVAVTAADFSGNESPLSPRSMAGPVMASDNVGVVPDTEVQIISGPIGLIRHNDVHFRWNRFGLRRTFIGYFYQIDKGDFQFTEADQISFFDLPEGQHVFAVKSADGTDLPASRAFTISTTFTIEIEPNDTITSANLIPFNLTMLGRTGQAQGGQAQGPAPTKDDVDWFRFSVGAGFVRAGFKPAPTALTKLAPTSSGFITLTASRPNGVGETTLKIYKSVAVADSIVGILKLNSFNKQREAFSLAVDRGEYFIEVSAPSESSDSEYQLAVNLTPLTEMRSGENWELEPNSNALSATFFLPLPQGRRLLAATWDGNSEQDWYQFELKENATLSLAFERAPSSGSTKMSLRDSALREIKAVTADMSNRWLGTLNASLNPGVYLLQIEPKAELKGAAYKLETIWVKAAGHNATSTLKAADTLKVELSWVAGLNAVFSLGEGRKNLKMYDDGLHGDGRTADGIYAGEYTVNPDDESFGGQVILTLEGENGVKGELKLEKAIVIDTKDAIPPEIKTVKHNVDRILTDGDVLKVTLEGEPNGTAFFNIGEFRTNIVMFDDGKHDDGAANDGVYSGSYTIRVGDKVKEAVIVAKLTDEAGNSSQATASQLVTIDTTIPEITSLSHNAIKPLTIGKVLTVTLVGKPGNTANFALVLVGQASSPVPASSPLPMFDDGLHGDEKANDGIYVGEYSVQATDNIKSAKVIASLQSPNGKSVSKEASSPVTLDAILPEIKTVKITLTPALPAGEEGRILTDGDVLKVTLEGEPNGTAFFNIGEFRTNIVMFDDGKHDDSLANDGVYSGSYPIRVGDKVREAVITAKLTDEAGNSSQATASQLVTIDTTIPEITSLSHNATKPFTIGEVLTVTLVGEPGNTANFDLIDLILVGPASSPVTIISNIPLFDDGKHNDKQANDGTYVGSYSVKEGDDLQKGKVVVRLSRPNGKTNQRQSLEFISIDTRPPESVRSVQAKDRPNDEGGVIELSWRVGDVGDVGDVGAGLKPALTKPALTKPTPTDVDRYNVYLDKNPIISTKNRQPNWTVRNLITSDGKRAVQIGDRVKVELEVSENRTSYYFLVTASDLAGNESPIVLGEDGSLSKAVEAIDNLFPSAVKGVFANDRIGDRGFFITVSWKEPSNALDFDHYRIYMSAGKFTSAQGLKRMASVPDRNLLTVDVPVSANNVDFFFGLVAVDRSGNESPLASDSVYGPVQAVDNIGVQPETPVKIISGPLGLIRQSDVSFNWSRFASGIAGAVGAVGAGFKPALTKPALTKPAFSGYLIKLDDSPFQFTNSNRQSFFGLNPGKHEFFVKSAEDSLAVASRAFIVAPTFTSESEPNDNRIQANLTPLGISIRGRNQSDADTDWYRIQIEESGIIDLHFKRQLGIGKSLVSIYSSSSIASDSKVGEFVVESRSNQRGSLSLGVDLGEYFIQVVSTAENPGAEYELSLSFNSLPGADEQAASPLQIGVHFEVEPNDFAELARAIQADFETVGLANKPADRDWYRLEVSKAELSQLGNPSKLLRINLARELGANPLAINVYFSQPADSFKVGTATLSRERQVATLLISVQNGSYFININSEASEPLSPSATNFSYAIKVTLEGMPADQQQELEPNATTANANLLRLGNLIKGTSWHSDADLDFYKLNMEQKGILAIRLQRPSGMGSSLIELLDASQTVIAKAKTAIGIGQTADISSDLNPGLYFIRVKPEGEVGFDEYLISSIAIKAADHSAFDLLSEGEVLTVSLDWSAGNTATFDFGNIAKSIPMRDDGKEGDGFAQDGIYTGRYSVKSRDDITNGFIAINLQTNSGAAARIKLARPISIDTTPPKIVEVRHDARFPLGVGKVIKATLIGEPKATGEFKILGQGQGLVGAERAGLVGAGLALPFLPLQALPSLPLYDDGKHDDGQADDGIYAGIYEVILGDNLADATLIGSLTDAAGNRAELAATRKLTLDTSPPVIRSVSHAPNRPLLVGDELLVNLEGEIKGNANFDIGTLRKGIKLFDDGSHGDKKADDGVYLGSYIVRQGDELPNAIIKGRLVDLAGNETTVDDLIPITLDTTPPKVASITHNAKKPLRKDELLIVNLKGDLDEKASFDIGSFKTDIPMFDDGVGKDVKANDGIYTGTYIVKEGDLAKEATVVGRLTDKSGNAAAIRSSESVTIDSAPPPPVVGVSASDRVDDEGNRIVVSWKSAAPLEDFGHYNIYVESATIRSTRGLTPVISSLTSIDVTSSEVVVANNNLDYHFAVTSVDSAGNESSLAASNLSQVGPVRAVDNTPPKAVSLVSATNRPDDQGKTIIVKWTEPSEAADFDHYNVYLDTKPISSLSGLKPIIQVKGLETISVEVEVDKDKTDYYLAVTVSDKNGNESALDKDGKSAVGPVQSLDEKPPEAVKEVSALDAPSDEGKNLIVFWKTLNDPSVSHYNIYLSKLQVKDERDLAAIEPVKELNVKAGTSTIATPIDDVDYYIAVTAVDFSNNESKLDKAGASVAGPLRSVSNLIASDKVTTITAGFDPKTSVTVPPGALKPNSLINITLPDDPQTLKRVDEADHFLQEAFIDPQFEPELVGTIRKIDAGREKVLKPIKLTLSYPDFTDNPEVESDLRVFRLNEKVRFGVWQLVSGRQRVNTLTNTVTVEVERLSVFRIARLKAPEKLDKLAVFPNPFIPSQSLNGYVTFTNLTRDATIEIFSLAGEKVKKVEVESRSLSATWNGRQEDGKEVAGGMYIYVVRNDRDKVVGKIVVVR